MGKLQSLLLLGGLVQIFDGQKYLHGVIPPIESDPKYPFYGATLLRKEFHKLVPYVEPKLKKKTKGNSVEIE